MPILGLKPIQSSIKCVKGQVKLITCHGRKGGGGEVYLYTFFNLVPRWGGLLMTLPGRFTPENDRVPIA